MPDTSYSTSSSSPAEAETPGRRKPVPSGLTLRALLTAVALTVLAGLWVRQSEIIVLATQVTESVPAIPGLTALMLLLFFNPLLRRIPGVTPFSRAELLVIFLFVTVASSVMGIGILQFLLCLMTVPFYYSSGGIPEIRPYLPHWLLPRDLTAVRRFYEAAPDGQVPWNLWIGPGLLWLGFFLAFWWTLTCLMALFYRLWAEEERLSFPTVFLPMEMTGGDTGTTPFFQNRLMWLGFALAAFYNGVNIAHALNPSFPEFGKLVDFSAGLTDAPWNAMAPLAFHFRPELIGLGYLVNTNISLTVWVSFFALKFGSVLAAAWGYEPRQLLPSEQGIGAYLALAAMLVWLARRHLAAAWRVAVSGQEADGAQGLRYRWAFLGLIVGFLAVWGFATAAGMAWWVALAYLLIVFAVALVYARMRGQVGAPLVWLYPFPMQKSLLLYTFGTQPFAATGPTTLPTWVLFYFLTRGYYPTMAAYQLEGLETARRAGFSARSVVVALCLAVGVGFVVGWINHLIPYYQMGALHRADGIWGNWVAIPEYQAAAQAANTPRMPEPSRILATGVGAGTALLLTFLQLRFTSFPLHPMGYAMTCSYGSLIWGSFLVVWLLKSLALRYGGMKFYRQTIPFFLGFALGHLVVAGIFWGVVGAWIGDAVKGYAVFFG